MNVTDKDSGWFESDFLSGQDDVSCHAEARAKERVKGLATGTDTNTPPSLSHTLSLAPTFNLVLAPHSTPPKKKSPTAWVQQRVVHLQRLHRPDQRPPLHRPQRQWLGRRHYHIQAKLDSQPFCLLVRVQVFACVRVCLWCVCTCMCVCPSRPNLLRCLCQQLQQISVQCKTATAALVTPRAASACQTITSLATAFRGLRVPVVAAVQSTTARGQTAAAALLLPSSESLVSPSFVFLVMHLHTHVRACVRACFSFTHSSYLLLFPPPNLFPSSPSLFPLHPSTFFPLPPPPSLPL